MRNEAVVGYLLHQRPYQEKRALYYLFSQQHGVLHGVGKKGAPLFMPLQLFASGKRELKTFTQIQIASQSGVPTDCTKKSDHIVKSLPVAYDNITGQHQYCALYLNEILWRLLPTEDPMPIVWQHYQNSLSQLRRRLDAKELRLCLRQFESHLFQALGFTLTVTHDSLQEAIAPDGVYRFLPDVGLVPVLKSHLSDSPLQSSTIKDVFLGADLRDMAALGLTKKTLQHWSKLHRQLLDHLLDYQPLHSRLLMQQQRRYQ